MLVRGGLARRATVAVMATSAEARIDIDELMAELRRYLVAVEAFRAEGREPVWLREERRRHGVEDKEGQHA